jgi:ribosomal protein S18 acetylase RimI-like enzyme
MPIHLNIRPARQDDFSAVAELWLASWNSAGLGDATDSVDDLRERIVREVDAGWTLYVAEVGGTPAGMLAIHKHNLHLDQLFVAPAFQGHGLGKKLLSLAREEMPDEMWLRVSLGNERAWRWYEREGFVLERLEQRPEWPLPRVYYRWRRAQTDATSHNPPRARQSG